jgi:hypothetical protein
MTRRLLVAPFLLASLILLFAVPASASCEDGSIPAYFNLRTVEYQQCPLFLGGASPIVYVYVEVYAVPFRKVRLSLPDPPLGTVVGESWNLLFTGDRTTGIEFDLGDCTTAGTVTLGYLVLFVTPGTVSACESWKIDDGCEIEDCDGVTRTGFAQPYQVSMTGELFCSLCCWQCCPSLPQYNLFPPDGEMDVPLDVALSWEGTPGYLEPEYFHFCYVRISTDPACGTGQTIMTDCTVEVFSPDFLEPKTTYYWQVGWNAVTGSGCSSGALGESPIRSFTTAGPLPVSQTTWGRVKAMYRD